LELKGFVVVVVAAAAYILSPLSTNHITSCLGSRVDMVSNLDPVSMIFALSL
jgi:hypothetical protein